MYADRYTGDRRFHPGGLAAAVGINAAVVAALMVAAPLMTKAPPVDRPFTTYPVPIDPPPPPDPVQRVERPAQRPIDQPVPPLPLPPTDTWRMQTIPMPPLPSDDFGDPAGSAGSAAGPIEEPTPVPAPVIVAPGIDPRFAADFQPLYPPSEQRMGNAGKVTVRVLVGIDGRVKQVERLSATSDAFFCATEAQALRRWRFRPGTRDGVAQEAWRTLTVTFVLSD